MIYTVRRNGREIPVRVSRHGDGLAIEFDGRLYAVDVRPRLGRTHFLVTIDGTAHAVAVSRLNDAVGVVLGPDRYEFVILQGRPVPRRTEGAGGLSRHDIHAPMPGLVVSTRVVPGDTVAPGRVVAVMEAMKMQMEIRAPAAGRVLAVPARAGEEVPRGAVLVTLATGPGEPGRGS